MPDNVLTVERDERDQMVLFINGEPAPHQKSVELKQLPNSFTELTVVFNAHPEYGVQVRMSDDAGSRG